MSRCEKGLILVTGLPSAFPEDAVWAAPPPQLFKATPP